MRWAITLRPTRKAALLRAAATEISRTMLPGLRSLPAAAM